MYMTTLSPSVDWIDAGELATDAYTLGIAHPTGYPFFILVGWLFSHLPIASTVILRLNIMAAFFSALGAGAVVFLVHEIASHWLSLSSTNAPSKGAKKGSAVQALSNAISPELAALGGLAAGVAAAFSKTWWDQSTSIEVYPMQLFFLPVVLTFFLRMLRRETSGKLERDGMLFALLLGLAFSNHMTTVLLAPACIYMYFARYGMSGASWKRIGMLAFPFLLGLSLYLYLPLRSSGYPLMDWGHPASMKLFLKHVTGGQYKIWMFSSSEATGRNWSHFWSRVPMEFSIIGAILALGGLYFTLKTKGFGSTRISIFTLLLFFGCLFYAVNYDIHDIDSYFLLAYLTVAIWIGIALVSVWSYLPSIKPVQAGAIAITVLAVLEIGVNYSEVDESGNYMVEDYAKNMLNNLPPNAIVFSTQWDFWVSAAFYYQNVEHLRPDVLVVDKAMLRDRPWYYSYLHKKAPEVMNRVHDEEANFMQYLRPFDLGEPFNDQAIGPAYKALTDALVRKNLDHPVFVTPEIVQERDELFAPSVKVIPGGIQLRMVSADTLLSVPVPKLDWRDAHYKKRNYYTDNARLFQAVPLASYAQVLLQRGDRAGAKQFIDLAMRFEPDMTVKTEEMNEKDRTMTENTNQRFEAIKQLRVAIMKNP